MKNLIQIKKTKNLLMWWDSSNEEVVFEKDRIFFSLKKSEIFPAKRGLESGVQRFWRRKKIDEKPDKVVDEVVLLKGKITKHVPIEDEWLKRHGN